MIKKTLLATVILLVISHKASSHCQIPCGIFDDKTRFSLMIEHVDTIEKSTLLINELQKSETPDFHQIARWTSNKEKHAQEIQDIVSNYFLSQRIKIKEDANEKQSKQYLMQLSQLHQITVSAMQTKQKLDVSYANDLREAIADFEKNYKLAHGH